MVLKEIKKSPITKAMTYCQCDGCRLQRARRYEAEQVQEKERVRA
jgi:hypothetical protein